MESTSFSWPGDAAPVIKRATLEMKGHPLLAIVVGPVGCGKSTFLKGILGETSGFEGHVHLSSFDVAYCDQTPWIMNGSIRENIIADSEVDEAWYHSVLRACALEVDLRNLEDGDDTIVGSKGIKLSGGQRQRLVWSPRLKYEHQLTSFKVYRSGCLLKKEDRYLG